MQYKKIILLVAAFIIVEILYNVPSYNNWFYTKIFNDNATISDQSEHMSIEDRMEYRYGMSYVIFQGVVKMLREQNDTDAIILLPPIPYVAKVGAERGFSMVDDDLFYYFTGLKGDVATSPDVEKSKYALIVENHHMGLKRITEQRYLDSIIALYKPYYSNLTSQ